MQVLFSPACQVFEARYSKRCTHTDAHTHTHTHTHTHAHTRTHAAHTHAHTVSCTPGEALWHSTPTQQPESCTLVSLWRSWDAENVFFFFFLFYESICILPHQQAGPGFRIETVLIHRLKRERVRVSAFANMHEQNKYTERTSVSYDLHLSADLCVCACSGEANRACWRCTAARWLWWGEPLCSATPPAAAGCSAWGSAPRPAAPPCPLSPERHRHTTKQKPSLRSLWQEREGSDRYSGGFKETSGHT